MDQPTQELHIGKPTGIWSVCLLSRSSLSVKSGSLMAVSTPGPAYLQERRSATLSSVRHRFCRVARPNRCV